METKTELFKLGTFNDLNINDEFFNSLKSDYKNFIAWLEKKQNNKEQVFYQKNLNDEILAMLYLKEEDEEINLKTITYEKQKRIKIGTLKLSEKCRNQRLGEGAIGIALWEWQKSDSNQIYVTIFDKQQTLIDIFIKFGFYIAGRKENNELVLIKDKNNLNYETPFSSFPYINPNTKKLWSSCY